MPDRPTVAAIVPAAGLGLRLGADRPKALCEIAGRPLLLHALRSLVAGGVNYIVVVVRLADVPGTHSLIGKAKLGVPAFVTAGGARRQDSVRLGLRTLESIVPEPVDVILVHDAARAFVPPEVVDRVITQVASGSDVVVPVVPVADSIVTVDSESGAEPVDRAPLRVVQTPQGFKPAVLHAAHAASQDGSEVTDDASLAARHGVVVTLVEGHPEAFKVTHPLDLLVAEALVASRS